MKWVDVKETDHDMGTKPPSPALQCYVKLMRATATVTARMHRHLSGKKLTVSQFGVLEALYHLGSLCQQEIGNKLLKTGGNITLVIDNLEKRGLVLRKRDTADRRYIRVKLTPSGRALIEEIFPKHIDIAQKVFSPLTNDELKKLGQLLKKLGTTSLNHTKEENTEG